MRFFMSQLIKQASDHWMTDMPHNTQLVSYGLFARKE
jgi:hypothetical protein